MIKKKVIIGSLLIILGIELALFSLALGLILISAGVSAIFFYRDEDSDD